MGISGAALAKVCIGGLIPLSVALFVLLTTAYMPESKQLSDFGTSFYPAAQFVKNGKFSQLYPPLSAKSFRDAPFDLSVRASLKQAPTGAVFVFMYSPLLALLLCPFAALTEQAALLIFQLLSIVGLGSMMLLCQGDSVLRKLYVLTAGVLFLPVLACLWVGQVSILIGLLPLAFSYFACVRGRFLLSGFICALCLLKPQLFPFVMALVFGQTLFLGKRVLVGFVLGGLSILVLSVFSLGAGTFDLWMHSLTLSEQFVGGADFQSPPELIGSFPAAVLASIAGDQRSHFKYLIYGASLVFILPVLALLAILRRKTRLVDVASFQSEHAKTESVEDVGPAKEVIQTGEGILVENAGFGRRYYLDFIYVLCGPILFLCSPRLLVYDLVCFLPTILLASRMPVAGLKPLAISFALVINGYILAVCVFGRAINPLFLAAILLILSFIHWYLLSRAIFARS